MDITEGATLTGGSVVTLQSSGVQPGRSTFVGPDHTRATPETVAFTVSGSNTGANPVARSGITISFGNREVAEGCCTTSNNLAQADIGVRYGLACPETMVDDLIARIRAVVYTQVFVDQVKKGILPST